MADDLINRYVDRTGIESDTKFMITEFQKVEDAYRKLLQNRKNLSDATSTQMIVSETKQARLEVEKLRAKNLELTAAMKEQRLEAQKAAAQRKEDAIAEKQRIEDAKKAAGERQVAEVERIRALKEQKQKQEELAAIEQQRLDAERQRQDMGTFDIPQGSGQSGPGIIRNNATSTPFVPQGEQQNSILYLAQLKAGLKENIATQKELEEQLKSGQISQSQFDQGIVAAGAKEQEYRALIKQTTAEIKARAEAELSVKGTIDAARKENSLLTKERDQLPVGNMATQEDIDRVKELNAQIDKNNELIDSNSDLLARQKINIGNYPNAFGSAFKTLNKEFTNLSEQLSSGKFSGAELDQLKLRMNVLQNATALTGKEFKTVAEQQNAYSEAAKQIGLVYGTNSDVFKKFSSEVKSGNKTVGDLSKSISASASSSGAFTKGLRGVLGMLRSIANVIPGLGIGSLILLMLIPLKSLGESFVNMFKTINQGKENVKAYNDINLKATETIAKQRSEVDALTSVVSDGGAALNVRKEALEKLIEINPDYLRGLSLENINTDEGRKILEGYNRALKNKAELQASQQVYSESNQYVANLKAEKDALLELSKAGKVNFNDLSETQQKFLGNFNTLTANFKFTASLFNTAISKKDIKTVLDGIDEEIKRAGTKTTASLNAYNIAFAKSLNDENTGVKGLIEKLQQRIQKLQKDQPTLLSKDAIRANVAQIKSLQDQINDLLGTTKSANTASLDQFHKKNLKAMSDYSVASLQILRDMYKDEMDDQKRSEADRFASLDKFIEASKQLNEKSRQGEIDALNNETSTARRDASKIADAKMRSATLAEIEAYETNQLKVINQKYNNDLSKINKDGWDSRVNISNQAWEKMRDEAKKSAEFIQSQQELAFKRQIDQVEVDKYNALLELQKQYQSGAIKSVEEFNAKKQKIEEDADAKTKAMQLERLRVANAVFKAIYGIDNLDIVKQMKQLEYEITKSGNDQILASDVALAEAQKELQQRKKDFRDQALTGIGDFVNMSFEAQKAGLDKESKDLEERTQRQIDLINASTLAEEDKQARIKEINEAAAAQRDQINKRMAEDEVRQAKFNKAMSILSIGVKTAETIFGIMAKAALADPISKIRILAQIPWVLGSAALQTGLILAQPIPKFRHGKNNDYEGPAIVGDGGISEFMVREDGTIEKTPPKDTLTYVGKRDIIYPNLSEMIRGMAPKMPGAIRDMNFEYALQKQTQILRPLLTKIANKRENHISAKDGALVGIWKYGAGQAKYIDENTNW